MTSILKLFPFPFFLQFFYFFQNLNERRWLLKVRRENKYSTFCLEKQLRVTVFSTLLLKSPKNLVQRQKLPLMIQTLPKAGYKNGKASILSIRFDILVFLLTYVANPNLCACICCHIYVRASIFKLNCWLSVQALVVNMENRQCQCSLVAVFHREIFVWAKVDDNHKHDFISIFILLILTPQRLYISQL